MSIEEMRSVDVRTVDPETLVDITSVHLDGEMPRKDRIRNFLEQIPTAISRVGTRPV